MKTKIFAILILLLILPIVSAVNLQVNKVSQNEVYILDTKKPVQVTLELNNLDTTNDFTVYNLIGFQITPDKIHLSQKEKTLVTINITPRSDFDYVGFYTLPVYLKTALSNEIEKDITFESVWLKKVFEIGSGEVDPQSNSIKIYIQNTKNYNFNKINVDFKSPFFQFQKEFSLEAKEKKEFDVTLKKEDFKKLMAGDYTLNADIKT